MLFTDYDVAVSNSQSGNHVRYGSIAVDMPTSFKSCENTWDKIECILITHRHGDHWNESVLKRALKDGKRVYAHKTNKRFFNQKVGKEITSQMNWFDDNDFEITTKKYKYKVSVHELYHDVHCVGFTFEIRNPFNTWKVFHATDTGHLSGINAPNCHIYGIETNYCRDHLRTIESVLAEKGQFNRFTRSRRVHLSKQQAIDFVNNNRGDNYQKFLRLHKSNKAYK